jgi:hypothetical protein
MGSDRDNRWKGEEVKMIVTSDTKSISVWLLVLMVGAGGIGSLSVIVMFPFASVFGGLQITALSTGMGTPLSSPCLLSSVLCPPSLNSLVQQGLNGFFLSLLALLQAPGLHHERFGVSVFFYILISIVLLSMVAFVLILGIERLERKNAVSPRGNRNDWGLTVWVDLRNL